MLVDYGVDLFIVVYLLTGSYGASEERPWFQRELLITVLNEPWDERSDEIDCVGSMKRLKNYCGDIRDFILSRDEDFCRVHSG